MAITIGRKKRTSAIREFTDRLEPRKAFWTRFQKMKNDGSTIITFYGAGGVGKSSLLGKLQEEINSLPQKNIAFALGNFEKITDTLSLLQEMRRTLEDQGCIFPLFSTGEFYYLLNTGQKNELDAPKIESVMDKNKWLSRVKKNWAKPVAIVDFFLPGANAIATGMSILGDALINYWKGENKLDEEHEEIKRRLDLVRLEKNPYEIYKLLPELFAQDVNDWLTSKKSDKDYLVVFLDTYEALVNEAVSAPIQRNRDAWLRSDTGDPTGIIFLIPNTLWVIAGRNKLRWDGDLADELDQHLITALSQEDSNYFLTKAGIATQQLRDDIYRLTKGLPIFLDLCVDVYTGYKQQNSGEPEISVFGKKREEVVNRLIKYMDDGTQDMIKFLCILGRWTDKLAFELGTKTFNFSQTTYGKTKNFSFVQSEDFTIDDMRVENFSAELFTFDRTVQSILFPSCGKLIIDKLKSVADKYFSELLDDDAFELEGEYLFCMEYWARLTARLAETPEELRERYEKNFEAEVTPLTEILAWFDISENILKIFMDEFTEETGKFKAFQETAAFAYLEEEFGDLKQEQGRYQEAYEYNRNAYERFLRLLGEKHPDTVDAMNNLAHTLNKLGHYDEALKLQEKILALSKEIFGEDSYENVMALNNLAVMLNDLGRYGEALNHQEKILAWHKKNSGEDNEDTVDAMHNLANTLNGLGRYDEALELFNQICDLTKNNSKEFITAAEGKATVLNDLGRYNEALKLQRQILKSRKKILGDEHPDTVDALSNLAVTLCDLENYSEALNLQRQVLELRKKILSDEHPDTVDALSNLAVTLSDLENYDEAVKLQRQVLELRKKILGDEHPDTVDALSNLAVTLSDLENYDEAVKLQRQALELRKKILGDEHPDTVDALSNLAVTLCDLENYDEALKLQRQVLELRKKILGDEHPDTVVALSNLSIMLSDLEDYDEALKFQRQVLKWRKENFGEQDEDTLSAMNNLAMTLNNLNRRNEAQKIIKRAFVVSKKVLSKDDELFDDIKDTYQTIFKS